MKKWLGLAILGALLGAARSDAATWRSFCQSQTSAVLYPGETACSVPTSNSDDPEIIGVQNCENVDLGLYGDLNGDGTSATALTATLQSCPVGKGDGTVNTDAKRDLACEDYANGTITGGGHVQGAGIPSGFARVNLGGTFAGDPGLFLKCNGPLR